MNAPKFQLGRLVATANAMAHIPQDDILRAIQRHAVGDWGDLDETDRQENENSLLHSRRLLSAYSSADGTRFWIITEADRSATTVLLPEDY